MPTPTGTWIAYTNSSTEPNLTLAIFPNEVLASRFALAKTCEGWIVKVTWVNFGEEINSIDLPKPSPNSGVRTVTRKKDGKPKAMPVTPEAPAAE